MNQVFTASHAKIQALCDDFQARRREITAASYKEDSARHEFITPFFEALNWDVRNEKRRSIYEKDVITEKREDIAGTIRAADYAFRRPGSHLTAFFVEAKKPSLDIRKHESCYQAVLYGWNASTPLVVLTNFRQFIILDARGRPDKNDATRHILREHGEYTLDDYRDPEKFAEIWGLFSRERVAEGSLEKAATALPRPTRSGARTHQRGVRSVDEEFLAQMEGWREMLAKSLKRVNRQLDSESLTSLTQRILDRLVFLRFLEDRGIERDITYNQLGKGRSVWSDFLRISRRLDDRYDGLIFRPDPTGCEHPSLVVDETSFVSVVENLAPHRSDYLFGSISVTILGSIYERFLGNVIVARDKTAVVQPRPEVRKAGGVYYTPDYIVREIVEQTVGRCISGKKPAEIENMTFADIACGSGSFLVEVFACLIRHHLAWYLDHGPTKWERKGVLRRRESDGDYVLTLAEKRRILLACIYGVDIDPQAVEVTQLSLYLRLMEDESFPSTQALFDFEKRALLPDLRQNIICGNSLIETDAVELLELSLDDEGELRPLDLRAQFPRVFVGEGRGFTAIVGNPPYVRPHNIPARTKEYLWRRYSTFVAKSDLYACFIERALDLVAPGGRVAYIVPHTWTSLESFEKLRRFILDHARIEKLVQLPPRVFADAAVETCIFSVVRSDNPAVNDRSNYEIWRLDAARSDKLSQAKQGDIRAVHLCNFQLYRDARRTGFLDRIAAGKPRLGDLVTFAYGFKTADDARFIHPEPRYATSKPFVPSAHIGRYRVAPPVEYVWYVPDKMRENRPTARPGEAARFESEKILVARMGKQLVAAYDPGGLYVKDAMMLLPRERGQDLKALLAILNSRLLNSLYKTFFVTIDVLKNALLSLPIPDLADPRHLAARVSLHKLADRMLHAESAKSRDPCEALEREIDAIVYALYGLKQDEIKLVEPSPERAAP